MIVFDRPDGKPCAGYLAEPGANRGGWGFVVIQEWWGLNDQIKETADFIASAGRMPSLGIRYGRGFLIKLPNDRPESRSGIRFSGSKLAILSEL
jgi:dienelactone hydrolase